MTGQIPSTDRPLTPVQVNEEYGFPLQTLANMRWRLTGPAFIKFGSGKGARIRYRRSDIEAWLDANTVQTSGGAK